MEIYKGKGKILTISKSKHSFIILAFSCNFFGLLLDP